MKKQLFAHSLMALAMVMLVPTASLAHGGDSQGDHNNKGRVEAQAVHRSNFFRNFNFQKFIPNACMAIDARVDKIVASVDANTDHKANGLLGLKASVADFELKARTGGFDTAALQAHMGALNTKVDAFGASYDAYVAGLRVLQGMTCGTPEYTAQLATVRTLLTEARNSAADLKGYYKATIKVDIQAIMAQVDVNLDLSL